MIPIVAHSFVWSFFRCMGHKWFQNVGLSQGTQLAVGIVTLIGQFVEHGFFAEHPSLLDWCIRWIDDTLL